jgi:dTDP-4-dehydrorhamnose reductase
MRILITGAGGQLGQDCQRCLSSTHAVSAFTSRQLDITQAKAVQEVMTTLRPHIVLNCAAYTAVDACEQDLTRCMAVNAQGPALLAESCAQYSCRLIHISTDYVFDGKKSSPYTEEDPVAPVSAYGRSKLAGEEAIAQRMEQYLILRTAWLYGMGGKNFLKTILRLALSEDQKILRVVDDQYGALTWTGTLAQQIKQLVSTELTGIVHATAEGSCTWFTGAKYFLEAMQVEAHLEACSTADYPRPAQRPSFSMLENRRLKEHGLHLMRDWQEDVDAFVRRYREDLLAELREDL